MIKNILLSIRNYFLKRKDKKDRESKNYDEVSKVGIMINNPNHEHIETIQKFVAYHQKSEKKIQVLCFFDKSYFRSYNFNFQHFSKDDINLIGGYSNPDINNFIKKEFDYLYCINNSPFLPFENILIRSNAKFRIGIGAGNNTKSCEILFLLNEENDLGSSLTEAINMTKKITD